MLCKISERGSDGMDATASICGVQHLTKRRIKDLQTGLFSLYTQCIYLFMCVFDYYVWLTHCLVNHAKLLALWSGLPDHKLRFYTFKLEQSRHHVCPGDDSHYPVPRNHFDMLAIKVNQQEQENYLFTNMLLPNNQITFLGRKKKTKTLSHNLQALISFSQSLEA